MGNRPRLRYIDWREYYGSHPGEPLGNRNGSVNTFSGRAGKSHWRLADQLTRNAARSWQLLFGRLDVPVGQQEFEPMFFGSCQGVKIGEKLFFVGRDEIFVESFFDIPEDDSYAEIPA